MNAVLTAVRGMTSHAVSAGQAPRHLVLLLSEVADERDLPAEARGEGSRMSFRLRARHRPRVRELRAGPSFDEAAWQASEPALEGPGQVSLHGLSPQAAAEILYGLQQRTRSGTATSTGELRQIAWELRCTGAAGIGGIAGGDRTQHRLARSLARHAAADVASQSEPTIILVYDSATLV